MIANSSMFITTIIILSVLYFELRYLRKTTKHRLTKRLILWVPSVFMVAFTIYLAFQKHFAPQNTTVLYTYLALEGFVFIPTFAYVACSAAGHAIRRFLKLRRNYGNVIGLLAVLSIWIILAVGITSGFTGLRVRHVTYTSENLPEAFNGYRIVQFSDLHIGSYGPSRQYPVRTLVDSINAQHADLIVFTGDLINQHPQELYQHLGVLSSIKAPDGIISVLGNHDYADYLDVDAAQKAAINREIVRLERGMGWHVLLNESMLLHRQESTIAVAGMENMYYGSNDRCISRGNIAKTTANLPQTKGGNDDHTFTIMLQHTPKCWREEILPKSNADLTLSGDTHGMQFGLFGWSPISLIHDEWGGFYQDGKRAINVSTGVGGLVPFRFGMTPEIVVITLRKP